MFDGSYVKINYRKVKREKGSALIWARIRLLIGLEERFYRLPLNDGVYIHAVHV